MFKAEFETTGAAFEGGEEVLRILRGVIAEISADPREARILTLYDVNGNIVGYVDYKLSYTE